MSSYVQKFLSKSFTSSQDYEIGVPANLIAYEHSAEVGSLKIVYLNWNVSFVLPLTLPTGLIKRNYESK